MNCTNCGGWGRLFIKPGIPNKTEVCPVCEGTGREKVPEMSNLENAYRELIESIFNPFTKPRENIVTTQIQQKNKEKSYTDWPKQTYVDEFLSMKCCGDVLNVCNPIGKNARKEITETMALIKRVKPLTLHDKGKYNVLDLCAGNALTSVLAVHLLPVDYAIAIDKRPRDRQWNHVKRFQYKLIDIYDIEWNTPGAIQKRFINKDTIIVSSHPCGELARRIVSIYKQSNAKALFMLPCCYGKLHRKYPQELFTKMGHDWVWCYDLAQDIGAKLTKDVKCISPRNIMLSDVRE